MQVGALFAEISLKTSQFTAPLNQIMKEVEGIGSALNKSFALDIGPLQGKIADINKELLNLSKNVEITPTIKVDTSSFQSIIDASLKTTIDAAKEKYKVPLSASIKVDTQEATAAINQLKEMTEGVSIPIWFNREIFDNDLIIIRQAIADLKYYNDKPINVKVRMGTTEFKKVSDSVQTFLNAIADIVGNPIEMRLKIPEIQDIKTLHAEVDSLRKLVTLPMSLRVDSKSLQDDIKTAVAGVPLTIPLRMNEEATQKEIQGVISRLSQGLVIPVQFSVTKALEDIKVMTQKLNEPGLFSVNLDTTKFVGQLEQILTLINWQRTEAQTPIDFKINLEYETFRKGSLFVYRFANWLRKVVSSPAILKIMITGVEQLASAREAIASFRDAARVPIHVRFNVSSITNDVEEYAKRRKIYIPANFNYGEIMASLQQVIAQAQQAINAQVLQLPVRLSSEVNTADLVAKVHGLVLDIPVTLNLDQVAIAIRRIMNNYEGLTKWLLDKPLKVSLVVDQAAFEKALEVATNYANLYLSGKKIQAITLKVGINWKEFEKTMAELIVRFGATIRRMATLVQTQLGSSFAVLTQLYTKYINQQGQNPPASATPAAPTAQPTQSAQAAQQTASSLTGAAKAAKNVTKHAKAAGKAIQQAVGPKTRKEIDKTTKHTEYVTWTVRGYIKDISRVATGILMSQGFYAVLGGIQKTLGESMKLLQQFERTTISFKYLLNTTDQVATLYSNKIREWATDTEYSVREMSDAFRQLLFAGVSVEHIESAMYILSGTAAVLEADLGEVVGTMLQIQAASTVAGSELRRLSRMGYPIAKILRTQLGLTQEDLENISDLKIPGDVMFKALVTGLQEYAEAAKEADATSAAVAGEIFELTTDIVGLSNVDAFTKWTDSIRDIAGFLGLVRKEILAIGQGGIMKLFPPQMVEDIMRIRAGFLAAWDGIKRFGRAIRSILGFSLRDFVTILGQIAPAIGGLIMKIGELVEKAVAAVPQLRIFFGALMWLTAANVVTGVLRGLYVIIIKLGVVKVLTVLFHGLAKAFSISWKWGLILIGILAALFAIITANSGKISEWLQKFSKDILDMFGAFSDTAKLPEEPGVEPWIDDFGDLGEEIDKVTEAFKPFLAAFDEVYNVPELDTDGVEDWAKIVDDIEWPEVDFGEDPSFEDFDFFSWIPFEGWQEAWDTFSENFRNGKYWDDIWNAFTNTNFYKYWSEQGGLLYDVIFGEKSFAEGISEAWNLFIGTEWYKYWSDLGGLLYEKIFGDKSIGEGFNNAYNEFMNSSWGTFWGNQGGALYDLLFGEDQDFGAWLLENIALGPLAIPKIIAEAIFGTGGTNFWDTLKETIFGEQSFTEWIMENLALGPLAPIKILVELVMQQDGKNVFQKTGNAAKGIWEAMLGHGQTAWDGMMIAGQTVWDTIETTAINVWDEIKLIATTFWEDLKQLGIDVWNGAKQAGIDIWDEIKLIATTFWGDLKQLGIDVWNGAKQAGIDIWDEIKLIATTFWDDLKQLGIDIWGGIKDTGKDIWDEIKSTASTFWGDAKQFGIDAWNTAKDTGKGIWDEIELIAGPFWDDLEQFGIDAWNTLEQTGKDIWDEIKLIAYPFWEDLKLLGSGIWESIKDTAILAWDNLIIALQTAWDLFLGALGIKDLKIELPDFWQMGKDAIGRFIQGFKSIRIPKLKLNVTLEKKKMGIFGEVEMPKFDIQWNRTGAIYDRASLIGVAEAGKEAIVPLSGREMRPFARAIASELEGVLNTTSAPAQEGSPVVYVQYLIADERGVRELERRLQLVRLEEDVRRGRA